MWRSAAVVLLLTGALGALTGCTDRTTTCFGIEPDGEVEKLRPCPQGWPDGSRKNIKEDEFKSLEVVDLKKTKKGI